MEDNHVKALNELMRTLFRSRIYFDSDEDARDLLQLLTGGEGYVVQELNKQ